MQEQRVSITTRAKVEAEDLLDAAEDVGADYGPVVSVDDGVTTLTMTAAAHGPLHAAMSYPAILHAMLVAIVRCGLVPSDIINFQIAPDA